MRYLLLIVLLAGCGPKFKAGDCAISKDMVKEPWENKISYHDYDKILQVGKRHYLIEFKTDAGNTAKYDYSIKLYDYSMKKTDCPEWLK